MFDLLTERRRLLGILEADPDTRPCKAPDGYEGPTIYYATADGRYFKIEITNITDVWADDSPADRCPWYVDKPPLPSNDR